MNARGAMSVYLNKGITKRPQRNKQSTPRDASIMDLPPGGGHTGTHSAHDCSILLCNEIGDFLLKDKAKTLEHYVKVNFIGSTGANPTKLAANLIR